MKSTNVLFYVFAMFFPILFFVVLTGNSNERYPGAVWILCIMLMGCAGVFSSKGFPWKSRAKWIILSALGGAAEAAGLIYLA